MTRKRGNGLNRPLPVMPSAHSGRGRQSMPRDITGVVRMAKKKIDAFVKQAVQSFKQDPADTAFQRGYLTALLDAWEYANEDDGFTAEYRATLLGSRAKLPDVTLQ